MNRDVDNIQPLAELLNFTNKITELPEDKKPHIVALSGFQLISDVNEMEHISLFLFHRLNEKDTKDLIVHTEMAAFSSMELHDRFLAHFYSRIDSIGANEREMVELVEFLRRITGRPEVETDVKARMSFDEILDIMREIMELIDLLSIRLNRLHIHTLTNHFLCFDKSKIRHIFYFHLFLSLIHDLIRAKVSGEEENIQ